MKSSEGCTVLVAEKPRPCDWKMGAVKKRASKECGGFNNWTWTDDTYTKYVCNSSKKKYVNEEGVEMCWFPELGWVKGLDSNGNPVNTGEYRDCGWRERGTRTAEAVDRGTKECGGFMNWIWLDEHHSKYKCK